MAFELTDNARRAIEQTNLKPQIVFRISGYPDVFTTAGVYKYIRIGDPGLEIGNLNGDPWYIGGFSLVEGQAQYLSLEKGGVAKITQSLNPSKGSGTTVSRLVVPVIDKNQEVSRLISPGQELTDVLGRECEILLGFENTAFPEDYIKVLVAKIESVESSPGLVNFVCVSPEEQKRQLIFPQAKTKLTSSIGTGPLGSLTLDDTSLMPDRTQGPDGSYDPTVEFYLKIDDEILKYEYVSGSTVVTVTRGHYGSVAASHDAGADVESFIRFNENAMILALKLMLSGWSDNFVEDISATKFNYAEDPTLIPGAIYMPETKAVQDLNLRTGDWCTVVGAANAGNNDTFQILDVFDTNNGSYIIVDGVLVNEVGSAATIGFRSQYDVYSQGCKMKPSFVDIERHIELYELFLSSAELDFITEEVGTGRDFLDEEIYLPTACFSVPRKGRASVSYHIGPIPGANIKTIDYTNVLNASRLVLKRGVSEAFFNEVEFSFDYSPLTGKQTTRKKFEDVGSKADIPLGNKPLKIESKGLTTATGAVVSSTLAADRLLKRYARGAEYIKGIEVHGKVGIPLEVGDIVLFDFQSLQVTDTTLGTRGGDLRLMEIQNKIQDNKTGKVSLDLVNTSFGVDDRYGLISPSSYIKSATSTTVFVLEKSFRMAIEEGRKCRDWVGAAVVVRSVDYATSSTGIIASVVNDQITLEAPLSFTPSAGMIMELDVYDNQPLNVKLIFGFQSDGTNNFADGKPPYIQL